MVSTGLTGLRKEVGTMELTKMELFKAMNDRHTNLRDCEGMIISPVATHTHTYSDADGKLHSVLV